MAKIWVLDTETKGTGAQVVPLEKVLRKPAPSDEPFFVPHKPAPRPPEEPAPRQPSRFKIVDVVSRQVLAEDADARAAIDVLEDVRSIVDVHVSIWDEDAKRWRLLPHGDMQLLWGFRGR
jgi:hypothetical protein